MQWLEDVLGAINFLDAAVFLTAVGILFFFVKKAWPVIKKTVDTVEILQMLPEMKRQLDANTIVTKNIDSKVNALTEQVKPLTGQIEVVKQDLEDHIKEASEILERIEENNGNP